MKARIVFVIFIGISVAAAVLFVSDSTTRAEQPQRCVVSSGVLTPGVGQRLRVTLSPADSGSFFQVRWRQYTPAGCNGMPELCRHTIASQGSTEPIELPPNQAAYLDLIGTGNGVSVGVHTNDKEAEVAFEVIDESGHIINYFLGSTDVWLCP